MSESHGLSSLNTHDSIPTMSSAFPIPHRPKGEELPESGSLPMKSHLRRVSLSSPRYSSPLSRSFGPEDSDAADEDDSTASATTASSVADPRPLKTHRRRSSSSSNLLSASPVLTGSYVTSLLSGRMASAPSPPARFTLHLGITALDPCPPSLRGLPHLKLPFGASWYELNGPYSGSISLLDYYSSLGPASTENPSGASPAQLKYGYRVPPKGQLQLLIANDQGTPLKQFIIPYELSDMRAGQQTVYRQVWNSHPQLVAGLEHNGNGDERGSGHGSVSTRETLRYAVELHFIALPERQPRQSRRRSSTVGSQSQFTPKPATAKLLAESDDSVFPFELDLDIELPSSSSSHNRKHPAALTAAAAASDSRTPVRDEGVEKRNEETTNKRPTLKRPRIFLTSSIRLAFASHPPEEDEVLTSTIEWGSRRGQGRGIENVAEGRYFPYSGAL